MSTVPLTVPLRMIVDDELWDAEDLAGRLGIVAHAAFLRAGFVPYGDEPNSGHLLKQVDETGGSSSAPSLSRRYTAAWRREGAAAPAEVAVQELLARGNGDLAFRAFLLARDGYRSFLCEAVLDAAAQAPLLSGSLEDAARALEEAGSAGARLWDALAEWVFPVLLHELRARNATRFASLPDDAKVEVLKRLTDWKDLARVECTSRQLRRLVAERDGELWKPMYESMKLLPPEAAEGSEGLAGSWKERSVNAWRWCYEEWMAQRRREREAELQRYLARGL